MNITLRKSDYIKLIVICTISIAIDYFLFIDISSPPAWDQGYHLSNLFKMYNIISNDNINLAIKIDRILNVTDSYRGPLTYFLSSLKLYFINNTQGKLSATMSSETSVFSSEFLDALMIFLSECILLAAIFI